jgi:hypothetical protein
MDENKEFEAAFAEHNERERRFKLVHDFMVERLANIKLLIEEDPLEEAALGLNSFYLTGMRAAASLISDSKGEDAKRWLEEYKNDLELRNRLPELDSEEVIDAIASTIDQEPN